MSYVRLNIIDQAQTISGEVHGSEGDAIVAALAAEPETIDELALALARFVPPQDEAALFASSHASQPANQGSSAMATDDSSQTATDDSALIAKDKSSLCATHHASPFRWFARHENFEPYDAGIIIVDLAARVVAVDSTYSLPSAQGEIRLFIGEKAGEESSHHQEEKTHGKFADYNTERIGDDGVFLDESAIAFYADASPDEVSIPYRLSDDWLFVYSVPEYEGLCQPRREARLAQKPFDAREVLYGKPLLEFIACEGFAARHSFAEPVNPTPDQETIAQDDNDERVSEAQWEIISAIHAKWLMTQRADLQGRTPRQVLLARHNFIDSDLHSRELQWSFTNQCPPPLSTSSKAYLYAGFGTHESVVYYDLIRHLLSECFAYLQTQEEISTNATIEFLEQTKTFWLAMPSREYEGKIPSRYTERERRRIPFVMSAKEAIIDADCPLCLMSEMFDTPGFWHLDGSHMDNRFEFSFYASLEEWEAEQRRWEEFNREFERDWQARKEQHSQEEALDMLDDDEPLIQ